LQISWSEICRLDIFWWRELPLGAGAQCCLTRQAPRWPTVDPVTGPIIEWVPGRRDSGTNPQPMPGSSPLRVARHRCPTQRLAAPGRAWGDVSTCPYRPARIGPYREEPML